MTTPYGPPMAVDPLVAMLLQSGGGPYGSVHEGLGAPSQPVNPPAGWQGDYAHVPALQTANQPGSGYLDALALALQGNEINVPTQRYKGDSGGFGVGLISGLEHGFSTSRLADMQHRQALQNALTQQAHDTNVANHEASVRQQEQADKLALKGAPDGKDEWSKQPTKPSDMAAMPWLTPAQANGGLTHAAAMELKGQAVQGGDKAYTITAPDAKGLPWLKPLVGKTVTAENAANLFKPPASSLSGAQFSLTPEAQQAWARLAATTGIVPSTGFGASGARARGQIMNAVPQFLGGTGDIASNKASFSSDQQALNNVQKMYDATSAFERTALANAGVLEKAMQKIPDTGSPWLNTPLRKVAVGGLGSADVAAYNTAMQTVIPEFSRILNSPTMAGQLTDQARKELGSAISGNMTLNQLRGSLAVLKTDAANRRASYSQQLSDIHGRIGDIGAPAPAAPAGSVLMVSPNGVRYHVPSDQVAASKSHGYKTVGQ